MARRSGLDPALGRALGEYLLAEMPPPAGAVVSGFWPMGPEIDIRPLLEALPVPPLAAPLRRTGAGTRWCCRRRRRGEIP